MCVNGGSSTQPSYEKAAGALFRKDEHILPGIQSRSRFVGRKAKHAISRHETFKTFLQAIFAKPRTFFLLVLILTAQIAIAHLLSPA